MSAAFESIQQGLKEAIEMVQGKKTGAIVHEISSIDVASLRNKIGMTQSQFASTFGISLGTLRHWERGDRTPRGPARVLLTVLAKNPGAVLGAICLES